ncbi:hypothetical protein [Aliarcobacter butzleri]|uniref:hypothetical protein n=1 Tax=Aliarcobacter butzleri TaxID=28197 RepID=UPI0021B2ADAF|nr:hypothetical protein [Aliarcobacter butzleri]MCT7536520.1 hypothetical protein [Aliarcobacter butzleri]MCT7623284.1 hypothetical protein [Aliarcobacter butzleri]
MKKIVILAFIINFFISNLFAASQGIDDNAINKEISNLISQVAPKTKKFKWSCETISSDKIPFTDGKGKNIVKKCIIDTDIGITIKATCKYFVVSKNVGETECISGW